MSFIMVDLLCEIVWSFLTYQVNEQVLGISTMSFVGFWYNYYMHQRGMSNNLWIGILY